MEQKGFLCIVKLQTTTTCKRLTTRCYTLIYVFNDVDYIKSTLIYDHYIRFELLLMCYQLSVITSTSLSNYTILSY